MCVGKWTVEKLTFGKDPSENKYMKRQVSPVIRMIITKCSSAAFVRTIFCRSFRVRLTASLFNLIAICSCRPCIHAYVVSVYMYLK